MNSSLPFDRFYQKYKDRIFAYLLRMTGDYQKSLDFMQESFTRYFSSYRHQEKNQALLYTIARNTVFDSARKNKGEIITGEIEEASDETPEERLIEKQQVARISMAMGRLSPDDRNLLRMVASQDLTYQQIGRRLGLREGNVKIRVHRARIRLRDLLERKEK